MSYKEGLTIHVKYKVEAINVSPICIKEEDSLKYDTNTGKLYIPGSSIAGAFRNYYEQSLSMYVQKKDNVLFSDKEISKITFYDAFPTDNNTVISSRPGLMINEKSMTVNELSDIKKSGSKFSRDFLCEGQKFLFIFEINDYSNVLNEKQEHDNYIKAFEDLLQAFAKGDIRLGSNKMLNYGMFELIKVERSIFDFTKIDDTIDYLLKQTKTKDITSDILEREYISSNVRFEINADIETPLLIKDDIIRSNSEPDGVNIMDNNGNYIIPGSSIKGVLRSRANKIKNTFDYIDQEVVDNIFGLKSNSKKQGGHISRLCCYDCNIKEVKTGIYNKIKIDYFTGGTVQGALTDDEALMGKIHIICKFNPIGLENYDKELGLLLLVLRDLCIGDLNIGSGYAVGRGFIKAKTLTMNIKDQHYTYDFTNPSLDIKNI